LKKKYLGEPFNFNNLIEMCVILIGIFLVFLTQMELSILTIGIMTLNYNCNTYGFTILACINSLSNFFFICATAQYSFTHIKFRRIYITPILIGLYAIIISINEKNCTYFNKIETFLNLNITMAVFDLIIMIAIMFTNITAKYENYDYLQIKIKYSIPLFMPFMATNEKNNE